MRGSHAVTPVLVVLTAALTVGRAAAQQGQGDSAAQAAARLVQLINRANQDGYRLAENAFSFGGGLLRPGETKWVAVGKITLKAGERYRFLAAGDGNAVDVDLQLRNADGWLVAADMGASPEAVVDFVPRMTAAYLVRLRLRAARGDAPGVCLVAMTTR